MEGPALPAPPDIDGFALIDVLGRGPLSRLWRARHIDTGLVVALRILTGRSARDDSFYAAFEETQRRVARLDHPRILPVLAFGRLPDSDAWTELGQASGQPWTASPLARAGSLEALLDGGPADEERTGLALRWAGMNALLAAALEALAEAHSHGLLHLDLRPSSVLFGASTDEGAQPATLAPSTLTLGGFSVARARAGDDRHARMAILAGTPGRMPPEQVDGDWRRFGPWTDLYAFGVLAWQLLTGDLPFGEGNRRAVLYNQLQRGPSPFAARLPVPPEVEGWLQVLLSADPAHRFRCAADAARALGTLGPPEGARPRTSLDTPTLRVDEQRLERARTGRPLPDSLPLVPPAPSLRRWSAAAQRAGAPMSALRRSAKPLPADLRGRLWSRLLAVFRSGRARILHLRGSSAIARALCEDLVEQARRTGLCGATVQARCGPGPAARRGVGPALATAFGAVELERDARADWLERRLGLEGLAEPWLAAGLAEEIGAAPDGLGRSPGLEALAFRALGFFCRARPALLWLDEAGDDAEALGLARHLLLRQDADPMPLLVLMTGALADIDGVEVLDLGDEDEVHHPVLDEMDIGGVIVALGGPDSDKMRCAEQGAVLGEVIAELEWRALCGDEVEGTAGALVQAGLAEALPLTEGLGWILDPGGLRAALLTHAASRGRRSAAHRRAADALERDLNPDAGRLQDIAWHRLQAGDLGAAWTAASAAARLWQARGRPWRARDAVALASEALDRAGAKMGRRVAELRLLEAEAALAVGDGPGAQRALSGLSHAALERWPDLSALAALLGGEAAIHLGAASQAHQDLGLSRTLAQQHGLAAVFARASLCMAAEHLRQGDAGAAIPLLRDVLALPHQDADPGLPVRARLALAAAARASGDLVEAGAQLRQALREAEAQQDPSLVALARVEQGRVHRLRGRPVEARRVLEQAVEVARTLGAPELLADAWSELGAALRDARQLDEAERCLSRALTWAQTAGRSTTLTLLHTGRLLAESGRTREARGRVDEALDRALRLGERLWIPPCKAALVQVAAGLDDWMVFDIGLDELSREPWIGVTQLHEVVGPLEEAGRLASERGHLARAEAAWALCARLWAMLGDEGRARSLRRRAAGQEDAHTEEAPRWEPLPD